MRKAWRMFGISLPLHDTTEGAGGGGAAATAAGAGAGDKAGEGAASAGDGEAAGKAAGEGQGDAGKAASDGQGAGGADGSKGEAGKESGGKDGAADAAPKAPDKYELKVPESGKAVVTPAVLKQLEEIARASNWTNEDAQAALEEHVAIVERQAETYKQETLADPTYGGDKFDETQRLARRVIDRVRPASHARRESFLAFLGSGGAGNHIEVVSFLADLGRMMGEDAPSHQKGGGSGEPRDAASVLYDNPNSPK